MKNHSFENIIRSEIFKNIKIWKSDFLSKFQNLKSQNIFFKSQNLKNLKKFKTQNLKIFFQFSVQFNFFFPENMFEIFFFRKKYIDIFFKISISKICFTKISSGNYFEHSFTSKINFCHLTGLKTSKLHTRVACSKYHQKRNTLWGINLDPLFYINSYSLYIDFWPLARNKSHIFNWKKNTWINLRYRTQVTKKQLNQDSQQCKSNVVDFLASTN